jgi:hypothetical protein
MYIDLIPHLQTFTPSVPGRFGLASGGGAYPHDFFKPDNLISGQIFIRNASADQ